jgi:predicted O-linked N-acetylglucosamine transferase (SPINDLY family)
VARPDDSTERFQAHAQFWRNTIDLDDEEFAAQVRNDQIDILVDFALHTSGNRLLVFARKPAPVQVTFAGYPGSTGLRAIDYRLSDPFLDPAGSDESIYSERTVRLAHSFWCYDPLEGRDLAVNALPASAEGSITFGCLNDFRKINDGVLRVWAKILRAVPSSRLLALVPEGPSREHIVEVLGREGISGERVGFVARQPRRQYLEYYHRIDISLDTLPYNGHTTSLDSLWMGVPVLTLTGETIVGRASLSILNNIGLPELVARTEEEYLQLSATLAHDLPRLAQLRSSLRQRMQNSVLMDETRFARQIEDAYRAMWRGWCANSKG